MSKRFVYLLYLAFPTAPGGLFAQVPPLASALTAAEQALAEADRAQAAQWAPESYGSARMRYEQALALQLKRKKNDAERSARIAEAQAELAMLQARKRQLDEEIESKVSANNALRRDLLINPRSKQP